MSTMTGTSPAPHSAPADRSGGALDFLSSSVRGRVLATMLAFMAAGLLIAGTLAHLTQAADIRSRHQAALDQEVAELQLLADTRNDDGSIRHTTVDSLMSAATEASAPDSYESVLAVVDGVPRFKPLYQDYDLSEPQYLEPILAAASASPGKATRTTITTAERDVLVEIVHVTVLDDPAAGIFAIAVDQAPERRDLMHSSFRYAAISLVLLLAAGIVGNSVTQRLLQPIADLREATEEVTVRDLSRRVPVPESQDDIAALAHNFNAMLARLQAGVEQQRQFTSDVGHELRTPITIVQGTLEMTDLEDPADVAESREIALDELDRMNRIVGDLSELARSARPDYVVMAPIDMLDFVRDAYNRISKVGPRDWVLEGTVAAVGYGDEQRLMQAVVQLAANAVRYSEDGSQIRLATEQREGPLGPEILISVSDDGLGIPFEHQARIFERFHRVDEVATSRGGTGLGLSIVKAIMDAHGGRVELWSEPGVGSTFTLVLGTAPSVKPESRPDTL